MTKQTESREDISTWGPSDSWRPEFSNCFEPAAAIEIEGKRYPSTEHYYQARKFNDAGSIDIVLSAATPLQAKFAANKLTCKARKRETMEASTFREGRPIHVHSDAMWNEIKESVMFQATFAKYRQHPKLRMLLLSTGDITLVEPNIHDAYWGCGQDGLGRNRLGHVLMEVRRVLRRG